MTLPTPTLAPACAFAPEGMGGAASLSRKADGYQAFTDQAASLPSIATTPAVTPIVGTGV